MRGYFTDGIAVVLCGGKSSRMGRPKALLPFDGEPLVAHIARALGRLFPEVVVVAAPGKEFVGLLGLLGSQPDDTNEPDQPNERKNPNQLNQPEIRVVVDEVAHQGPVGSFYYGIGAAGGDFSFVTSCDAAFLNPALIEYLVRQLPGYDVVAPYWESLFQPLHAVYRKSVRPLLKDQLERGELRPIYLYDKVPTRKVAEDEIRSLDPEGWSFFNMNSPEDYRSALRRWEAKTVPPRPVPVAVTVELFGVPRLLAKRKEVP